MTSPETSALRTVTAAVITRRGSGADAAAVAAATRRASDDLAAVLAPLISQAGVEALLARALHLAQREYPPALDGEDQEAEPSGRISLWLERQDPPVAGEAAAALLAEFGGLLTALIGEPLTTRYMRKAWPDAFSDTRAEGKRA